MRPLFAELPSALEKSSTQLSPSEGKEILQLLCLLVKSTIGWAGKQEDPSDLPNVKVRTSHFPILSKLIIYRQCVVKSSCKAWQIYLAPSILVLHKENLKLATLDYSAAMMLRQTKKKKKSLIPSL